MDVPGSPRIEFESIEEFESHIDNGLSLKGAVFQDLDLRSHGHALVDADLSDTVFLGCRFDAETLQFIYTSGAIHFPELGDLPYRPYRARLYSVDSLYDHYVPGNHDTYDLTTDARIFKHYRDSGSARPSSIVETLARRLHDHAITDALEEVIEGKTIVAIMGGHGMSRDDGGYSKIAALSRELSMSGFLMASGGGPGAMEATNLGAGFANLPGVALSEAITILKESPGFDSIGPWLDTAFSVRSAFFSDRNQMGDSIGIPTWYFGHEPPNIFASHIAKYFANSVREEGLVSIAMGGIVFAPGSAGTIQEIFQDATQNHYVSLGKASPMVFLNKRFWTEVKPVYPLLELLSTDDPYRDLLLLTDEIEEAAEFIQGFADSNLPEA